MKPITWALLVLMSVANAAWAAPPCTSEPKSKWMPQEEMKAKIVAMGYKINRFLIDGTCYEIYGRDKDGRKAEVYFNPVDGSIVKQRVR